MLYSAMVVLQFALAGAGPASQPAAKPGEPPPQVKAAMAELWRRGFCLLSSVYQPAEKQSAVPRDIGNLPVLSPRVIGRQAALLCYAVDGRTIWAADDQCLYRVDAGPASGGPDPAPGVRTFGPADGLPDEPIQAIAPAGGDVWLATRVGLARLDTRSGRIEPVEGIEFNLAALAVGGGRVWLLSDRGAWAVPLGQRQWEKLADFPGQDKLAQVSRRGFWSALWADRVRVLIPSLFATQDGLYAVCMNQLLRYDPSAGDWSVLTGRAWQALPQGRTVWALITKGVFRYDAASSEGETFESGQGPAAGRPVAMAAAPDAFYLLSQPDFDPKEKKFVGGGISRYDSAARSWTVTDQINGTDVRFATAVVAGPGEAWVACRLYDRAIELGAHPGMARVTKWLPHVNGLGLAHLEAGQWRLLSRHNLKTESRWVLGQKGSVKPDTVGPDTIVGLCRNGSAVWGVYQVVPEHWYSGYFFSVGCLARQEVPDRDASQMGARQGGWTGQFDQQTDELGLAGEQPEVMLLSHSHGPEYVRAEGCPAVLGLESVGGDVWAICECGLFRVDPESGRFAPVVREGFRAYWAVTCGAAGPGRVWFGGDGGTISALDRKTGQLKLLGVASGRRVVALGADGDRAVVKLAEVDVCLPVELRSAAALPEGDALSVDSAGRFAQAGPGDVKPATASYTCKGNYLLKGEKRVAFLKGVFKPQVLCEDPAGGKLWLATYDGIASVPIPKD